MVAATTIPIYIRRYGCCCFTYLVVPIVIAMLMEFLFGVWFMNQRQGLLPLSHTSPTIMTSQYIEGKPYTRIGRYEILERVPHDTDAFTQGLVVIADAASSNGSGDTTQKYIYEGTGIYGSSQLRCVDIQTGNLLAFSPLEKIYFGEGIAHYRDQHGRLHIIQLTWKRQRAFEYIFYTGQNPDRISKSQNHDHLLADRITSWRYQTTTNEGWGITYSPVKHVFYVSDGSEYVHIWDADTKKEIRKIAIKYKHLDSNKLDQSKPISMINEMEYDPVTDTILANVWREDIILRIDPESGFVTNMYNLKNLLPKRDRTWSTDVLNGIALTYDPSIPAHVAGYDDNSDNVVLGHDEIWVTGKYWPYMFRIRLIDDSCIGDDIDDKSCSTTSNKK
jgi:glutaminyl-peptide cyclotransferase